MDTARPYHMLDLQEDSRLLRSKQGTAAPARARFGVGFYHFLRLSDDSWVTSEKCDYGRDGLVFHRAAH